MMNLCFVWMHFDWDDARMIPILNMSLQGTLSTAIIPAKTESSELQENIPKHTKKGLTEKSSYRMIWHLG